MTHLIEILLIVSIITSVIMLMLLIILKVGVTVTSRPLTKEEIEKLENRKWPWTTGGETANRSAGKSNR